MIKYFCDDCGRQMTIDENPRSVDTTLTNAIIYYHNEGTDTHLWNETEDEESYSHQCKLCDINEHQEESFYFDEVYMADAILKKVEEMEEAKKRKPDKADDYLVETLLGNGV